MLILDRASPKFHASGEDRPGPVGPQGPVVDGWLALPYSA